MTLARSAITVLFITVLAVTECGAQDPASFLLRFDSDIARSTSGSVIETRVLGSFLLEADPGQPGIYRGRGRLGYLHLSGLPGAIMTDGLLEVYEMRVSPTTGIVEIDLFPGDPKPNEWVIVPPSTVVQYFQWFSGFAFLHENELILGSGYRIEGFDYPGGEIYATKRFQRQDTFNGVTTAEDTLVELRPVSDPPSIDAINIDSQGQSADDPEAGKKVELSADITVPFPFEVAKCTWTGNNIQGFGAGDVEDDCRWTYTPKEGPGPEPDTYGDKNLLLTVVYDFGAVESALQQTRSEDYKVFFTKKDDDDGNGKPNWFDYWGDDGAVPGLDDSDVDYDGTTGTTFGYYSSSSDTVFVGPAAAEQDSSITVPQNPDCTGGTFPGGQGIDIAAITLAHEKEHQRIEKLTGTDTDNDGLPDAEETGTSANDPDSCNLASVIHPDYSSYGDNEFKARQAELGVQGVGDSDWAVPGRQATLSLRRAEPARSTSGRVRGGVRPGWPALGRGSTANLAGNYAVQGLDSDGDGQFDALELSLDVNASEAGDYAVVAWIADGNGDDVAWARNEVALPAGTSNVQATFDGAILFEAGSAQPYSVSRVQLTALVGKHDVIKDAAAFPVTTTLTASDFDPPAARFTGNPTEQAVDDGSDGIFDRLEIAVDVVIDEPAEYEVVGQLSGNGLSLVASASIPASVGAGASNVTLDYPGSAIFAFRADGPYTLERLTLLRTPDGVTLDRQADALTTAAYGVEDFQPTRVAIDDTSLSDAPGPTDAAGLFTSLDVRLAVASEAPGPYVVHAILQNDAGKPISRASSAVGLGGAPGNPVVTDPPVVLSFPGPEISAAGFDGPYQVDGITVIADDGSVFDQLLVPFETGPYAATDFSNEPGTPSELIFADGFEPPSP